MQLHAHFRRTGGGFTLVELLVVITIIGILMAFLIPTIAAVVARAGNASIATELQDLARAMEAYKQFANDYPPDFTNDAAVADHITRGYPRNTRAVPVWLASTPTPGPRPATLDPAEAVVFWLSLVSTNPRDPLSGAGANYSGERKKLFDFDPNRLTDFDNDGWKEYVPTRAREAPYVYFDGRVIQGRYAYTTAVYPKQPATPPQPAPVTTGMVVRPYRSSSSPINAVRDHNRTFPVNDPTGYNTTEWVKPGGFQLLSAGLDNDYGREFAQGGKVVYKTFPEANYTLVGPDEDNMASFAEMRTLGDSLP